MILTGSQDVFAASSGAHWMAKECGLCFTFIDLSV